MSETNPVIPVIPDNASPECKTKLLEMTEVISMAFRNQKIQLIKYIRDRYPMGLREAKDFVCSVITGDLQSSANTHDSLIKLREELEQLRRARVEEMKANLEVRSLLTDAEEEIHWYKKIVARLLKEE